MKPTLILVVIVFVGLVCCLSLASMVEAQDDAKEEFGYVGVKTCKMCHNKEATGAQFTKWGESAHAKAFETLANEESMAYAKEHGIEDPQKDPNCLKCHVTAFSVMDKLETLKITMEEGVSCESCHGPGSGYKSKKIKTAIAAGEITAASVGLLEVNEATCVGCHVEEGNPFLKEFKYEERVKAIAHPIPKSE